MRQMGLYSQVQGSRLGKSFFRLACPLFLLLFANQAVAQDISTVLYNLRQVIVPLTSMILVISFVAGIGMIFHALTLMKKFGTLHQGQQTQTSDIKGPLVYLLVGAALVYLPSSTNVLYNSIFQTGQSIFSGGSTVDYSALGQGSTILSYAAGTSLTQQWADMANTLVLFIQFIGFLSFIRGWFHISHAGATSPQPGAITKGFTHIIAGICLINIVGLFNIIRNTILGSS